MTSGRVLVPRELTAQLLMLKDVDPVIHAAFSARLQGIIATELELTSPGMVSASTTRRVSELFLRPMIPEVVNHLWSLGVCPYRKTRERIRADDPERAEKYGPAAPKLAKELVPAIPHWTTYNFYLDLNDESQVYSLFESATDSKRIHSVKSILYTGPAFSPTGLPVSSAAGVLMEPLRRLRELWYLARRAQVMNACPTPFFHKPPHKGYDAEAAVETRMTGDIVRDASKRNLVYPIEEEAEEVRLENPDVESLYRRVLAGEMVHPKEFAAYLPGDYTTSPHHFQQGSDEAYQKELAHFVVVVGAVMNLPSSFLTDAKGGGIEDKQSTVASDNDRDRYLWGVDAWRNDLVNFFSIIYQEDGTPDVTVTLPIKSMATIPELHYLHTSGMISGDTYKKHVLRATSVHTDHLVPGPVKRGKLLTIEAGKEPKPAKPRN